MGGEAVFLLLLTLSAGKLSDSSPLFRTTRAGESGSLAAIAFRSPRRRQRAGLRADLAPGQRDGEGGQRPPSNGLARRQRPLRPCGERGREERAAFAVTPRPSGAPHVPFLLFIVSAMTAALREAKRDAAPRILNSATRRRTAKKSG